MSFAKDAALVQRINASQAAADYPMNLRVSTLARIRTGLMSAEDTSSDPRIATAITLLGQAIDALSADRFCSHCLFMNDISVQLIDGICPVSHSHNTKSGDLS